MEYNLLTNNIERVELNPAEGEEAEHGLYDGLGHADHAGGECQANCSTHELSPGEHVAREDEQHEHQGEPWLGGTEALPHSPWLPHDHWHGEEDRQHVEAVDMQHLHSARVRSSSSCIVYSTVQYNTVLYCSVEYSTV